MIACTAGRGLTSPQSGTEGQRAMRHDMAAFFAERHGHNPAMASALADIRKVYERRKNR